MDSNGAGAALHQPNPPGSVASRHGTEKDRARVRMNVASYLEKKENRKTGKRARQGKNRRF